MKNQIFLLKNIINIPVKTLTVTQNSLHRSLRKLNPWPTTLDLTKLTKNFLLLPSYFAREQRTRTGRIVKAPQYLRDEAYYTESGVPEAYAVLTTSEPLFHTKKTLTA